jgi:hypothetical protein
MPPCGCNQACACAIQSLDTNSVDMTVTGVGSAASPYVASAAVKILPDGTGPLATGGNLLKSNANGLYVSCLDVANCINAADLFYQFARKTADEAVTNSTVLQDDDHLFLTVVPNAVYEFEMVLFPIGLAAADMKFQFSSPVGSVFAMSLDSFDTALTLTKSFFFNFPAAAIGTASTVVVTPAKLTGIFKTAGTGGTLRLQWAQNTANATPSSLLTDSYMRLRRAS